MILYGVEGWKLESSIGEEQHSVPVYKIVSSSNYYSWMYAMSYRGKESVVLSSI